MARAIERLEERRAEHPRVEPGPEQGRRRQHKQVGRGEGVVLGSAWRVVR